MQKYVLRYSVIFVLSFLFFRPFSNRNLFGERGNLTVSMLYYNYAAHLFSKLAKNY